jgi:hypothetical protein
LSDSATLNGDDNTRKHLLRLFGIAWISDREGTCCQKNKYCSEASHSDELPHFSWTEDTESCDLAQVVAETEQIA